MTAPPHAPICACCQKRCWPMWTTLNNTIYCNGCYYIGCHTKPAECQRPLRDRIAEKVADALKPDSQSSD